MEKWKNKKTGEIIIAFHLTDETVKTQEYKDLMKQCRQSATVPRGCFIVKDDKNGLLTFSDFYMYMNYTLCEEEQHVFNLTAHRKLWNWLSKNPDKEKVNWPEWKRNGGKYEDVGINYCFCCQYVTYPKVCEECPLVWTGKDCKCETGDDNPGLFEKWDCETNLQLRAELAAQIRDLPVKEGIKTI